MCIVLYCILLLESVAKFSDDVLVWWYALQPDVELKERAVLFYLRIFQIHALFYFSLE